MSLGTVPFPPSPRSWQAFVDVVLRELVTAPPVDVSWEPVHLLGLDSPWVGVRVPSLQNEARAWVWDVVTPEDHERDRSLHDDPLALPVAQDTVIVDLHRDDDAAFGLRLQVPVREVPARIDVPASAVPPSPWRVGLASGWTSAAIGSAIVSWFDDHLGVRRAVMGGSRPSGSVPPSAPERFQVGEDLYAVGSSFDALLKLPPGDAARVTTFFTAVAESLSPVR